MKNNLKKRILSAILAVSMMISMVPATALTAFAQELSAEETVTQQMQEQQQSPLDETAATETEQTKVEICTATEGCTYNAGHEGNCSNYVAPTVCETEGCTYNAGHEGNCSNYVAPTVCETDGCTYAYGHDGDCSPVADQAAAQNVIDLIAAIGEVTLESEPAISAADTAYNQLTDAQKVLVTNVQTLEAAKTAYMQLSAVPAPAADKSVIIETGDVAEYPYEAYIGKIVLIGVDGEASGSGQNWEVELAEGTDPTQPITFELTSAVTMKPNRYFWVNGERLKTPLIDADPGSVTFVPEWDNGRATVTACVGLANQANGTQYTINLSIKGLAKEDFNSVRLEEGKSKKYFVQKVTLSGVDATAFSVSDTDFSGSSSGHKATVEYQLDAMPAAPVQLTFTMATSDSFYIACNGADRVEANGTYTTEVDLKQGTAYTFITYSTKSNSTVRGTYTVKFNVAGVDLNTAPTLKDSAVTGEEKTFTSGQVYTLNIASLFKDAELDDLSYTVQINGEEPVSAAADYSLLLDKAGDYTLVFRASDGKLTSEDCYTAKLKVDQNTAPTLVDGDSGSENWKQYAKFNLDLTKIFADAEGNALTYTVRVNGGSATAAAANYSYTSSETGTVTLVFQAKDHELTSPEYTLTLNVESVPKTEISTSCAGGETGDTWVKTITVIGAEIDSYEWNVATGHTESEEHILNIRLEDSVDDNAVMQLTYTPGYVNSGFAGSVSGPASVTLVDGEATVTVTTKGWLNNGTPRTYILNFTNKKNNAPVAAQPAATAEVTIGSDFTIDLDKVFSDPDGDALTYTVTANDKTVATDSLFTQIMGTSGEYTFVFTATDVWNAAVTHTVTVTVKQSNTTFDAIVKLPKGITPEFYITNGFDNANADICGDKLTATAGAEENGFVPYTVQVPENVSRISFRGKDAEGNAWGGMTAEVSKDTDPVTVVKVLGVIPSKVNNVYATAQQALFQLKDKDGYYATSGGTLTDNYGIVNYRFMAVAFGTDDLALAYTAYVVPQGGTENQYLTTIGSNKTFTKDQPQQITRLGMTMKSSFTVTVPEGAKVQAFQWKQYYSADEIPVSDTVNNEDGTVSWIFVKGNAAYMTYRASMEGKLTKVGYVNGEEVTITWSDSDPAPDCRTPYDTNTLYGSRGDDSMVVNVNGQNHLVMTNGGTFRLRGYRIWEVINNDTNNVMIQPDMHWNLTGDDIVTVTPKNSGNGNGKNNWLDLKATGTGVAYLEMSYDAMQVVTGNASGWGGEELAGFVFNACDPARTALVVVQVGNAATDVSFGISADSKLNGEPVPWDAEFDTLYFLGDSGELKLAPAVSSGSIAKVEVSGDKGASWKELTAKDGVYTAEIISGNNIIRVTKNDGTQAYQVVRGDKVSMTMTETKGDGDNVPEPGETFRLQLNGVHNPIGKMSGNYNPGYQAGQHLYYKFNGNTVYTTNSYQYDFVSNAWVDVTIPETAKTGDTFTLNNGYIGFNMIGIGKLLDNKENHRGITDAGHMTRGAGGTDHTRSILPEITLTVRDSEAEVNNVIILIDAIETAADKATAVQAARTAYAALSDAQKVQVNNYDKLTAAEKALADAADAAAAAAVEAKIRQIGEVTLDDEAAIEQAREAYNALTETQKELVDPDLAQSLENAEAELIVLKDKKAAKETDDLIDAIGEVTLEKESKIEAAKTAYAALTAAQKRYVTKLSVLEEADQRLQMLKNTGGMDYGIDLDEIVGYVTISFEDNGVRVDGEKIDPAYINPRGVIIPATKVPFKAYDTIASVTLRLLKAKGISAAYQGDEFSNFYLSSVGGFGEFDAGSGSGWMITWNTGDEKGDWFINKGASEFSVNDNDVVKWQYTCQLGEDIGDNSWKEVVGEVEALIDAIGTPVTLDSIDKVNAARSAYDDLLGFYKSKVENYNDLVEAERMIKLLIESGATEEDRQAAENVDTLIGRIGKVTLDSAQAIKNARAAYDNLSSLQKQLVANLEALETAENQLRQLNNASPEEVYKNTGNYIASLGTPAVGTTGGEWMTIGLARGNKGLDAVTAQAYLNGVLQYMENEFSKNVDLKTAVRLDANKSTDNSRVILALTAAGFDATSVGGYNLFRGLDEMEYVEYQGINGPIWALIALNSHPSYKDELSGDVTEEKLIEAILSAQLDDSGWDLANTAADADMTAMAVQALAPYYDSNAKVKEAVDKALSKLSSMQQSDGSFASVDGKNSESIAQVIVALTALGIDPEQDTRFIKKGMSPVDALCEYAVSGGGFMHTPGTQLDGMSTEQGYYALVSYFRQLGRKTHLYDMSDIVTLKKGVYSDTIPSAYDYQVANEAEKLINDIGEVKLENYSKIEKARNAYDKLTDKQKKLVDNYNKLLEAEDKAVDQVEDLIDKIGEVGYDSSTDVEAAKKAYNYLPEYLQKKVSNSDKLEKAEVTLKDLRAEALELIKNGKLVLSKSELLELKGNFEEITENTGYDAVLALMRTYARLGEKQQLALKDTDGLKLAQQIIAAYNHEDASTGIKTDGLEWNIRLVVEDTDGNTAETAIVEAIENSTVLKLWNIYLEDVITGEKYIVDKAIRIKVPAALLGDWEAYDELCVVHYTDDGEIEVLKCITGDEYISFNAAEFSIYAVVGMMEENSQTENHPAFTVPNGTETGADANADSSWFIWVIIAAVGVAALAVLAVMKKRTKDEE